MMMLRFTVLFLWEAWPQGLPGLPSDLAPLDSIRAGRMGAAGLMPALPSSVAPSGIPTRPIDEGEGRGDEIGRLSAQESERAVLTVRRRRTGLRMIAAPSEPAQVAIPVPCEGATGLMPGVAISVEPSGMPAGRCRSCCEWRCDAHADRGRHVLGMDCAIARAGRSEPCDANRQ